MCHKEALQTVLDACGEAMTVASADGRIVQANAAAVRFTGYPLSELIGLEAARLYGEPDVRRRIAEELRARGRVTDMEITGRNRLGQPRRIRISLWPLPGEGGGRGHLLCRITDAQEQRRTARALRVLSACTAAVFRTRDTDEMLRSVCEIIASEGGFPLVWIGMARHDPDKTVEVVASAGPSSAYLSKIRVCWSQSPEGLGPTGTCIREGHSVVWHHPDDPRFMPWRDTAAEFELRASIALPLTLGGHPVGALNIYSSDTGAFDTAERTLLEQLATAVGHGLAGLQQQEMRRSAELALRESEVSHRRLLKALPDVIFRMNPEGVFVDHHPSQHFDVFPGTAELVGRHYSEVMPPAVASRLEELVRHGGPALGTDELRYSVEVHGKTRHFELRMIPQNDGDWVGVVRDTTERHSLHEQLLEAQKLESVGRLAAGVAHDFNNLLTVIAGNAELMQDSDGPVDEEIEAILAAASRGASLTQQLLAFGRRQTFRPVDVDLGATLASVQGSLQRLLGEDILLQTRIAPDAPRISADAAQLEQALLNLAVNARDAMSGGGRLSIEVSAEDLSETEARRLGMGAGRCLHLAVVDEGCGMDPTTLEHAFEPFFTTKPPGTGTGLGLSSVYGIVATHNGAVRARSELGKGTVIDIWLPAVEEARGEEAPPQGQRRAARALGGSEHVLLVEDEGAVRRMAERVLRDLGYRVSAAATGAAALNLVEAGLRPDLLLTDVVMPGMSGPAVARALMRRLPDLKVLFMSGYSGTALSERGGPDSETCLLPKPFDRHGLAAAVRRALDECRATRKSDGP